MRRPRCESCGTRLYQIRKPYRFRPMGLSYFKWKAPLHCPNCGVELSTEKVKQVYGYDDSIFLSVCFGTIILIIVTLIVLNFIG